MRGDDMLETHQVLDHAFHAIEALAARVGFVAAHHGRPLFGGHSARARVRQQIDQNIFGIDLEKVIAGLLEEAFALFSCGVPQRFDALDAEWLDDRFHVNSSALPLARHRRSKRARR